MRPTPEVLDLFAVPDAMRPLAGGQGHSVVAGDLVLSPGRDPVTSEWLNPLVARLAADLDHERPRHLRLAMPIPTRDLRWVVGGWGATRFEPDTSVCRALPVLLATGRLLAAHLAERSPTRPTGLRTGQNRWDTSELIAFGGRGADGIRDAATRQLLGDLAAQCDETDLGPDQLVHRDLAGNVLLDADGVPVVLDIAPAWRPLLWAEAVCVLDAVRCRAADPSSLDEWTRGAPRQAMLRAAIFRLCSEPSADVAAFRRVVVPLLGR